MPPSDWVARKTPTLSCSYVARCDPGEQYSAEHLANSASFGLVVSPEGGVLMDPGGCERGVGRITIFTPSRSFRSSCHSFRPATLCRWRPPAIEKIVGWQAARPFCTSLKQRFFLSRRNGDISAKVETARHCDLNGVDKKLINRKLEEHACNLIGVRLRASVLAIRLRLAFSALFHRAGRIQRSLGFHFLGGAVMTRRLHGTIALAGAVQP